MTLVVESSRWFPSCLPDIKVAMTKMPLANSARVRQLPLAEEIRLTNFLEVEGNRSRNSSCTTRGYSRVRGNTKVNSYWSSSSNNLVFILDANSMSGAKDRVTYHRYSAELSSWDAAVGPAPRASSLACRLGVCSLRCRS